MTATVLSPKSKASKFEMSGVKAEVSAFNVEPKVFWDKREDLHKAQQESMEVWEKMTEEQQEALKSKTKKALAIMHDNVEHWLPDALSLDKTGDTLRIELFMLAAEVDAEVHLLAQTTSFEMAETAKATAALVGEAQASVALMERAGDEEE